MGCIRINEILYFRKKRVIQNNNRTFGKAYIGLFLILKRTEKCFLE